MLGHLEVGDGVTLQALGGPKQRALLAYLLLHAGEVVTTERLVDAVWGEEPPPTAAAVVYGYIRKLRAALEATSASLTTRSSGYVLEIPGSSLDVACFERLSGLGRQALRSGDVADARRTLGAALALWRGDALDGLDGDGFIHAERTRLESLRLATRLARIDADLRLGGAADVVGELEALVREHPLDEGIRGQLMLALYRSGNQVEALATYQDIRRALAEEVGLEPSRSLQELEVAILRHDTSLDAPAAGAAGRPSGQAPRAMSPGLRLVEAADACPFIGLSTFGVHDADVFFGRERLVSEMVARLAEHGFLGVVGPSGSGKSSAVRAGLVPAIEGGALGGAGWLRVILRPGPEPMRELDRVVFAALDEAQRARLPARGDPLAAATSVLPEGDRLLVVVDQFEELFTSVEDAATRAAFIAALVGAARSGAAAVVVALRADFYGRCAEAADLADLLAASQVLVGPMAREEYRAVIEGPASRAGLSVERALVERLLDEVDGRAGGLPLLSTALVELWERRDGRTIQFAALAATGGISGAVGRLAENAYGQLTDAEQEAARVVFLRLVGGGGGDVAARRRVPLAEFDVATNPVLERTLTVLTAARLLTADRGTVEVAHEALFREWPRLEGWLADDQESRRVRAHLREAAREWDGGGRPPSELYRGVRLAAVLDWTGAHDAELNELEHEFVAASHAAGQAEERRQRRANRRLRALLATALVGLMVAVAAGGAAVVQRQTADQATAEALRQRTVADTAAADAQAQRVVAQQQKSLAESAATAADAERLGAVALNAKDLDLSLLLARQAVALDDSAATRANLLADLARNPATLRVLRPVPGRPQSIFASADGSTLLTWNNGTEFAVIDGPSGATRYTRTWDPSTDLVGLTSSGRVYLFSFSSPATLTILDPVTGAVQRTIALPAAVTSQTFVDVAPDLSTFVSTTASGRSLTVWNAVTVAAERTLNAPPGTDFVGVSLYSKGYLVTPLVRNGAGFAGPGELAFWSPNASTPL
ncbi:MAG TPA: BTAD domain-containing putative transcriptional regulator, partial [Candidatus Limnocylindrales bacterium]